MKKLLLFILSFVTFFSFNSLSGMDFEGFLSSMLFDSDSPERRSTPCTKSECLHVKSLEEELVKRKKDVVDGRSIIGKTAFSSSKEIQAKEAYDTIQKMRKSKGVELYTQEELDELIGVATVEHPIELVAILDSEDGYCIASRKRFFMDVIQNGRTSHPISNNPITNVVVITVTHPESASFTTSRLNAQDIEDFSKRGKILEHLMNDHSENDLRRVIPHLDPITINSQVNGYNPLSYSSDKKSEETTRMLFEHGCKQAVSGEFLTLPLAIRKVYSLDFLNMLIEDGADPSTPNEEDNNAAHWAVSAKRFDILERFTPFEGTFTQINAKGKTPFTYALELGIRTQKELQTLVEHTPIELLEESLEEVLSGGFANALQLFAQRGVNLTARNSEGNTPKEMLLMDLKLFSSKTSKLVNQQKLFMISFLDYLTCLQQMKVHEKLELPEPILGLNIRQQLLVKDAKGDTLLVHAARQGLMPVVRQLVKAFPEIANQEHLNGNRLQDLLPTSPRFNESRKELEALATTNHILSENITSLKKEGITCRQLVMDTSKGEKCPALALACKKKAFGSAYALVQGDSRAEVDMLIGKQEKTPLMLASSFGHLLFVQLLLNRGANTKKLSKDGVSALGWSVLGEQPTITKYLVQQVGIDPRLETYKGSPLWKAQFVQGKCNTLLGEALLFSAREGNEEEMETLIADGADLDYTSVYGDSPRQHAVANDKTRLLLPAFYHKK